MPETRRDLLTIHLNEYFQCAAAGQVVSPRHWDRFETRIARTTDSILDLLDGHDTRATFYSSGWIADRAPDLLREIVRRGHEIAASGYHQRPVAKLTRQEFTAEVRLARAAIERAIGCEVFGYRCAGWLRSSDEWALEVLAGEGFRYDSSFYRLGFGHDTAPAGPIEFDFAGSRIVEFPIPSVDLLGFSMPFSGGTYLRQLPSGFLRRQFERWPERSAGPRLVYFQAAELDPAQPRITAVRGWRRVQKYRNIDRMRDRVTEFLESYRFEAVASYLGLEAKPVRPDQVQFSDPRHTAPDPSAILRPVTIVVPCYEEEESIPYLANALHAFAARHADEYALSYVFVDDGSPDGTHDKLQEVFGGRTEVQILRLAENAGVAGAILAGIRAAPTETVGVIDCDCSYDPETLAALIPELRDGVDMVTASPYHPDGGVTNVPQWRLVLSNGLSTIYRRVLTTKLFTYTACCRVYRKSAVADLKLTHTNFVGIAEVVFRLDARGAKIVEVPAVLETRFFGASKMKTLKTIAAHSAALAGFLNARRKAAVADRSAPSGQV